MGEARRPRRVRAVRAGGGRAAGRRFVHRGAQAVSTPMR